MIKKIRFLAICLAILTASEVFTQIKVRELPPSHQTYFTSASADYSTTREIIYFSKGWVVFEENASEEKTIVSVPSSFSGTEELTYKYEFQLSEHQIFRNNIYLHSLGLGHSAEFTLNGNLISKTASGEVPFKIVIPEDLLYPNDKNELLVKVIDQLDTKTTIPLKSGFLSPKNSSGLFRDIYLELIPKKGFNEIRLSTNSPESSGKFFLNVNYNIGSKSDSLDDAELRIELYEMNDQTTPKYNFSTSIVTGKTNTKSFEVITPALWSPGSPVFYHAKVKLIKGGVIVDDITQKITFYSLKKTDSDLTLNGLPFDIKGVNYNLTSFGRGSLLGYETIKSKLEQIKSLGFNTVRFNKIVPNPIAVDLCLQIGLFALVEIPLNSVPENFISDDFFVQVTEEYIQKLTSYYRNHSAIFAIGVGSGYLANSKIHTEFISSLAGLIKDKFDNFVYASFVGVPSESIPNIDFIGIELYSNISEQLTDKIETTGELIGSKSLFLSDVLYPAFMGSANGYANPNSFEAQAKFYELNIELSKTKKLAGFFLNCMYDYEGNYSSLYAGNSESNIFRIGILDENGKANRIAYKIIDSKLNNSEKVIIPLGTFKEDSPFFFIIMSLLLSISLAVLINSKRKFREDATRALLRPYNFFADIRDNRILTGFHSVTLMFILGATHALLFTILLYFFRSNILIEKILLAFGGENLVSLVSDLAWNPISTFLKLYLFAMIMFVGVSLIAKFASFFVKNRVTFLSIFIVVIWSFLPVVILLPLELILYKVLTANLINPYVYLFLALFSLWLFQRLLKGLYVIFDVPGVKVYFYGILCLLIVVGTFVLYQQYFNSAIYYAINAYKQYQLM